MSDISKQCTITNNSGRDIVIAVPVAADETGSSNATAIAGGRIEILKTTLGELVIKSAATATVSLDHSFKAGADSSGYVQQYDLIACDAQWLTPLAALQVAQQGSNGTSGYAPQTIGSDTTAMDQALKFYQTLRAFPDSELTANYLKAIQSARDAALSNADGTTGSAAAMLSAIDSKTTAFFKATKDYQQTSLANIVDVDACYNAFPPAWTKYQNSISYYLYGVVAGVSSFIGKVTLQKGSSVDAGKTNCGYSCSFLPAKAASDLTKVDVDASKAVALIYANGVFSDDPASASPKIALRPAFMQKQLFTAKAEDLDLTVVLTGQIGGSTTVGLNTPQGGATTGSASAGMMGDTKDDKDKVSFWDSLKSPSSLSQWATTIAVFGGAALAGIALAGFIVYRIYKAVSRRGASGQGIDKSSVQKQIDQINSTQQQENGRVKGNDIADYELPPDVAFEIATRSASAQVISGLFNIQMLNAKEMLKLELGMSNDQIVELQSVTANARQKYIETSKLIGKSVYEDPSILPQKIESMQEALTLLDQYQKSFDNIFDAVQTRISTDLVRDFTSTSKAIRDTSKSVSDELSKEVEREGDLDPEVPEEIRPELIK